MPSTPPNYQKKKHLTIKRLDGETGLPVTDVVRFGTEKLGEALMD